jgi:hypothetical protein
MSILTEPYPSRDRLVTKDGYASEEFDKWLSQNLEPAVQSSPNVIESVNPDPLNAAVPLTPIIPTATAGVYRFSSVLQILTPDPVSNSVQVVLTYTRNGVVQTETFPAMTGTLTTTHQGVMFPFRVDGRTPVSYQVNYASNTPNLCVYALNLTVELVQAVSN